VNGDSAHPDVARKMKLFIRLTSEINDGLRGLLRYRGDLSRFIEEALTTTDLYRVALLSPGSLCDAKGTTASTGKQIGAHLKAAATHRRCSVNSLANSAIAAWLSSR
jgi:hypothetical protein